MKVSYLAKFKPSTSIDYELLPSFINYIRNKLTSTFITPNIIIAGAILSPKVINLLLPYYIVNEKRGAISQSDKATLAILIVPLEIVCFYTDITNEDSGSDLLFKHY